MVGGGLYVPQTHRVHLFSDPDMEQTLDQVAISTGNAKNACFAMRWTGPTSCKCAGLSKDLYVAVDLKPQLPGSSAELDERLGSWLPALPALPFFFTTCSLPLAKSSKIVNQLTTFRMLFYGRDVDTGRTSYARVQGWASCGP